MNHIYTLSVTLGKGCYRHIQISGKATLYELHQVILEAFDFDDDHLHAFFMNNRFWDSDEEYVSPYDDEGERLSCDYKLDDFHLTKGAKFAYLFDFGDEWRFSIRVLNVEEGAAAFPSVVRSVGKAPSQY